jgi:ribosome biogenesis protein BMS1
MLRLRLKKHRWHPRILKTNDPLVFSIGWRRFQTLPLYSVQVRCACRTTGAWSLSERGRNTETRGFASCCALPLQDDNERHRYLKYTPEHMHCFATLYGPVTPPNTGVVAFQTLSGSTTAFRIACTGVTLELDEGLKIVKKLKLVGYPLKIYKNTAFIRGEGA